MKTKINYLISLGILGSGWASAQISLTASDAAGISSFNTGANWAGGQAPIAGQTYSTGAFTLGTPADSSNYAFAGNSLTLATGGELRFQGSGNLTVPSLILDGGSLSNNLGGVHPSNSGFITATGGIAINADTIFDFGIATTSRSSISLIGDLSGTGNLIVKNSVASTDPVLVIDGNTTAFTGNYVIDPSSLNGSNFLFTIKDAWKPTNTLTSSGPLNSGLMFATTEAANSTIGGTINNAGNISIQARALIDGNNPIRRFDMIINSAINCAGLTLGTYNAQAEIAPNTVTLASSPNINGRFYIANGGTLNPTTFFLNGQITDTDLNSGVSTFETISFGSAEQVQTPYNFVWGGDNRIPPHYAWSISNNRTFDLKGYDQELSTWSGNTIGNVTIKDSTKSGNSRLHLRNPSNATTACNFRATTMEISDVTIDSEYDTFTQGTSNWVQNNANFNVNYSSKGFYFNNFTNVPVAISLSNQSNLTSTGYIYLNTFNDGVLVNVDASSRLSSASSIRIAGNTSATPRLNIVNVNGGTLECRTLLSLSAASQLNLSSATIRAMGTESLVNRGLISSEVTTNLTGKNTFDTQGHAAVVRSILRGGSSDGIRKIGTGSLQLLVANTYTGDTQIDQGSVIVNGTSLADASSVIMNGGILNITGNETVNKLYYAAQVQPAGTYGSTSSAATFKDDSRYTGTGVLTVTSGASTAEAFFANAGANFGLYGSDTLPAADPDKDGLSNLLELVLGTSPAASSSQPAGVRSGNNFIFSFRKTQASATVPGGITIQPQYGTNLTNWTAATNGVNGVTVTTTANGYEAGVDRVDVSIPQSLAVDAKLFSRLNVTLP